MKRILFIIIIVLLLMPSCDFKTISDNNNSGVNALWFSTPDWLEGTWREESVGDFYYSFSAANGEITRGEWLLTYLKFSEAYASYNLTEEYTSTSYKIAIYDDDNVPALILTFEQTAIDEFKIVEYATNDADHLHHYIKQY